MPKFSKRITRPIFAVFLLAFFLLFNVAANAQTQEQRAAAMIELLKEKKDNEERVAREKAKDQIKSQAESGGGRSAPPDWVAQLIVGSIVFTFLWYFIGRHVKDFLKIFFIKRRLEKMTPEERKQFFLDNPDL